MRSFAVSKSTTEAATRSARPRSQQIARGWVSRDARSTMQPEMHDVSTPMVTHSMADVLQRCGKDGKKSNNKKQAKQKAAAAQAKKSKQSKADRNVNQAAKYGDSGRRKDVQEIVRKKGLQGETIAHGKGKGGSNTSNKYKTIIKGALDESKSSKSAKSSGKEEDEYRPRPSMPKKSASRVKPQATASAAASAAAEEEDTVPSDDEGSADESLGFSDEEPVKETFRKNEDDDDSSGSGGPGFGAAQEIPVS